MQKSTTVQEALEAAEELIMGKQYEVRNTMLQVAVLLTAFFAQREPGHGIATGDADYVCGQFVGGGLCALCAG